MSLVTYLESPIDGTRFEKDTIQTTHEGRPLLVRYDLSAVPDRDVLATRPPDMWRYREFLPCDEPVSLGETMTPLLRCRRLGAAMGVPDLFIKDESRLPTGSFKARGMAVAISMAKQLGITRVALPTAGNAGGAAAAYAARAGIECLVLMPKFTPAVNRYEAGFLGARSFVVDGHIGACGKLVAETGWFALSTLKEPYRLEGKKTMGLELAEQMGWELPEAIYYPTGGGTGLIGMWKAFAELEEAGWMDGPRPKMVACQSSGCAPLAPAFAAGERFAEPVSNPETIAAGLCVPGAVGDFLILDAVRESGGAVRTADETQLTHWMGRAAALEGISLCPEAAACLDALASAPAAERSGRIVVFNTGAAQKYVEVLAREPELWDGTLV